MRSVRLSVRPSVCLSSICRMSLIQKRPVHIKAIDRTVTLLRNLTLEVEPTGRRGQVAETATQPWPLPLQKHSPGGCTLDMSPANCRRRGHNVSPSDI